MTNIKIPKNGEMTITQIAIDATWKFTVLTMPGEKFEDLLKVKPRESTAHLKKNQAVEE
jgi:hypothetical protein